MLAKKFIKVKNEFKGYHKYSSAPEDVAFLRSIHRHTFYVETIVEVRHLDRELEFFQLQEQIRLFVTRTYYSKNCKETESFIRGITIHSCEKLAEDIALFINEQFPGRYVKVEVSEDKECSSIVIHEKEK